LPGSGLAFCREVSFPIAVPLPNVVFDVKENADSGCQVRYLVVDATPEGIH